MSDMPAQRLICVQNSCHLCPKNGLNLAKRWLYSEHKCNCWLKIVNHWDKRDNGVMHTGKEIKSGFKLVRMETDLATCKLLLRKKFAHSDINIVLL